MKKIYIVFIIALFLCTSCSANSSSETNRNMASMPSTESKVVEEDTVISSQLNIADYAQFNMKYSTLIDQTRMTIGFHGEYQNNRYALLPDGTLWTWKAMVTGYEPMYIKLMDDVVDYSSSQIDVLAVKSDGSLWLWELDSAGGSVSGEPVHIMDNVITVTGDRYRAMVIDFDGSLWAWGRNDHGELGDGTTENRNEPVKIMDNVASVSITDNYTMAVQFDGSLWAWGNNDHGQLGDGTTENRNKPVKIMDNVVAVSTNDAYTSMALCSDGSLWVWGAYDGWISLESLGVEYHSPVKVFDDVTNFSLATSLYGQSIIMVVQSDGSLWGWGNNIYGQLGNSDESHSAEPVYIMDDIVYVSAFYDQYVMAVGTDDRVWIWGKDVTIEPDYKSFGSSHYYDTPLCLDLSNLPHNDNELDWQLIGSSGVTWGIAACPPTWFVFEGEYDIIYPTTLQKDYMAVSEDERIYIDIGYVFGDNGSIYWHWDHVDELSYGTARNGRLFRKT